MITMMKRLVVLGLIFFWHVCPVHGLQPQEYFAGELNGSTMDWSRNILVSGGADYFQARDESAGARAMLAERRARIDAAANLYHSLGKVYIDSSITLEQARQGSSRAAADISAMVKQATVIETVRTSGRGHLVEVFLKLDLWDEQIRMFMPDFFFASPRTGGFPSREQLVDGECLIYIDTSGLEVMPALMPAILDENSDLVFQASVLGTGKSAGHSTVRYVKSTGAEHLFRTSLDQTVRIRAVQSLGNPGVDLQLSREGAERFRNLASGFRNGCSVNIIVQ